MGADWVTEAFQDNFPEGFEAEFLADAQFGNRVGHDDLFRCGMPAQSGG